MIFRKILPITAVIVLLFSACDFGMTDAMYYSQAKRRNSSSDGGTVEMEIDESVDASEIIPEGQYDPFRDGAWNDINYGFDGSKIKDYVFKASFDGQNVPEYSFKKGGWQLQDQKMGKSYYNGSGDGNRAQGYAINPAHFYRYDGYNPLTGKKGGRMERFQFYAMLNSQSGGGAVTLNNYLIAIDTYSKLVFAYGKVTATKNVMNNDLPTAFDAVDKYGKKLKFYEYDPIGAVRMSGDNLEITLYEEYKSEMRSGATRFFPSVHNENRAVATYEKAGRSPYYYVEDLSSLPQFLQNVASKVFSDRAKTSYYEYKTSYTGSEQIIPVYNGNDVIKTDWEFSSNGKSLTFIEKDELKGTSKEKSYTFANEIDDTSAKYKYTEGTEEKEITLTLNGTKLLENGKELGDSSFVDPGADFILRVRGMKYVKVVNQNNSRKTVVYEFSADGGTLTTKNMTGREIGDAFSGSGTYYFVEQKAGNSASALYQWTGNSIKIPYISIPIYTNPYFGVDLLEDGYKQIKRTRASSDKNAWDEDLGTFSNLPVMAKNYFSGESEVATRSNDSIAPDEYAHSDWLTLVAGLKFKYRPIEQYQWQKDTGELVWVGEGATGKRNISGKEIWTGRGAGMLLYEWEFSDDGENLKLKKTNWNTNKTESETFKFDRAQTLKTWKEAVYKNDKGESSMFSYNIENGELKQTKNGAISLVGNDSYDDQGPDFVLRVRGKTFYQEKSTLGTKYTATYTFDQYGTCTYYEPKVTLFGSEKRYTYKISSLREKYNDSAEYFSSAAWGIILDPVDGKNDRLLRMMGTGLIGAAKGCVIWNRDNDNNHMAYRRD